MQAMNKSLMARAGSSGLSQDAVYTNVCRSVQITGSLVKESASGRRGRPMPGPEILHRGGNRNLESPVGSGRRGLGEYSALHRQSLLEPSKLAGLVTVAARTRSATLHSTHARTHAQRTLVHEAEILAR